MPWLLLVTIIVAALIALVPVWRLRVAGWPRRWLVIAWVVYAAGIFLVVRFPGPARFLVPMLVLACVAPFVAGPERLARVLRGPGDPPRPVINVTPSPPAGLPSGGDVDRRPGDGDEEAGEGADDGADDGGRSGPGRE